VTDKSVSAAIFYLFHALTGGRAIRPPSPPHKNRAEVSGAGAIGIAPDHPLVWGRYSAAGNVAAAA